MSGFDPFPGLRPFEPDETHLFFGREGQSTALLRLLRQHRFVAVVGPSGSGKSSLVRAGLLPALHGGFMQGAGSAWRVGVMRPGADAIGNLARALAPPGVLGDEAEDEDVIAAYIEATLRRSSLGLAEAARHARLGPDVNVLVVVDQFEEIFRLQRLADGTDSRDDAAAFVKLLLEGTARADLPLFVLLTMRSDYLGDCAQFRDLPEAINRGQYLIPRMTRDERRLAITGPVAVAEGAIAPRLVNRLLNDVGDDPDQLPILQHALMRTWARWETDHGPGEALDLRHYEAVGTMEHALSEHADEAFWELSSDALREVAERIFRRLTERGPDNREIRRPTDVETLAAVAGASAAEVIDVVEAFRRAGRSFLTPPPPAPLEPHTLIDISHESLIRGWDRLRDWVDEEAESARMYRRLAETAALYEADRAALWRDPDLQLALDWWERDRPNEAWGRIYDPSFERARAFLEESRKARDARRAARRRRTRATIAALAAGLVLALGLAAYALYQGSEARRAERSALLARQEAEEERDRAEANERRARASAAQADSARDEADRALEAAVLSEARAERERDRVRTLYDQLQEEERRAVLQAGLAVLAERRARQSEMESNRAIVGLVDRALPLVPPLGALDLRFRRAHSLSALGDHAGAAEEYSRLLEESPGHLDALVNRSDAYLNLGRPDRALVDLDFAIERDSTSALAHANRAMALGHLGRFEEAHASYGSAIRASRFGVLSDWGQTRVAPSIRRVLRRRGLSLRPTEVRPALYYGRATVSALRGDRAAFERELAVADDDSLGATLDVYLNPLNWAWLHRVQRPQDYAAFAVEGAMWERAGFPEEAARAYTGFRHRHEASRDGESGTAGSGSSRKAEYEGIAEYVERRLAALGPVTVPGPEAERTASTDLPTLLLEAAELQSQAWAASQAGRAASADSLYGTADDLLTRALSLAGSGPDSTDIFRRRAWLRNGMERYGDARADCERALRRAPELASCHFLLGRSRYLESSAAALSRDPVLGDSILRRLELASRLGPAASAPVATGGWVLLAMGDTTGAVSAFERTLELDPTLDWMYFRLGALKKEMGRLEEAHRLLRTAVTLLPDSLPVLDAFGAVRLALGRPLPEVARDHAEAYIAAGDIKRRQASSVPDDSVRATLLAAADRAYRGAMGLAFVSLRSDDDPLLRGQYARARERAAERAPSPHDSLFLEGGRVLEALELHDQAIAALDSAIARDPDELGFPHVRADARLARGDPRLEVQRELAQVLSAIADRALTRREPGDDYLAADGAYRAVLALLRAPWEADAEALDRELAVLFTRFTEALAFWQGGLEAAANWYRDTADPEATGLHDEGRNRFRKFMLAELKRLEARLGGEGGAASAGDEPS